MFQIPSLSRRQARLYVSLAAGAGLLAAAMNASAADAADLALKRYPAAEIFTFLLLMLGPFKVIGPFWQITKGADDALTRKIAVRATVFASLALLAAAFLGEALLSNYRIPVPVLALSGGIILFLVALMNVLKEFVHGEEKASPPPPSLSAALSPLAFPTIVTPYGIAIMIVFLALSPSQESRLTVGGIVLGIMLLNLVVMLLTRRLLPVLGLVLPILGAVLGVIQVALGLEIINRSLALMGTQ